MKPRLAGLKELSLRIVEVRDIPPLHSAAIYAAGLGRSSAGTIRLNVRSLCLLHDLSTDVAGHEADINNSTEAFTMPAGSATPFEFDASQDQHAW